MGSYFFIKSTIIAVSSETIHSTIEITENKIYTISSNPIEKYFPLIKKAALRNIEVIAGIYLTILLLLKYLLNKSTTITNIKLIINILI